MNQLSPARRFGLALALACLVTTPAFAGGVLESVDITGSVPSPIPGQLVAQLVPITWDARCIPVQYVVNDTLDPIPNPAGPAFLSLADATAAMQRGFDSWNEIPTSYIDMQIVGTTSNPGTRGFDMVNELTFRVPAGFGAIASSPSTSLISDSFLADGSDLDGDGDSDVSNTISTCADIDGDGDIEYPEGNYPAGTILDNDVQYNSPGLRFSVADADVDSIGGSVDLEAIAVHEFGHSHGLSHTLDNQLSNTDGSGTTMYPFIDTSDADAEFAQRTIGEDDIAWSSFLYPEGSAASGPAALQFGDLAFDWIYGTISGTVEDGVVGGGIAGASVAAINLFTGRLAAATFSGTTQLSYDPATGGLSLVSPAFNIVNGDYTIPVPLGLYKLQLEAPDGNPVPASSVSLNAIVGNIFGQHVFNEEFWNGNRESAKERRPGDFWPVLGLFGTDRGGYDFVTNDQVTIANFGPLASVGFTGAPDDTLYAVRIPGAQIAAADQGNGIYINSADFGTFNLDASIISTFAKAILTTGSVSTGSAVVDLATPLAQTNDFIGQDGDFTPFYFRKSKQLGRRVLDGINDGTIEDLFLVLDTGAGPFPGVSAFPPLIGLSNTAPLALNSYISTDGGATWTLRTDLDFWFRLSLTAK